MVREMTANISAEEMALILDLIEERLSYGPWPGEERLSAIQSLERRLSKLVARPLADEKKEAGA
jgi:hypothetical protein